MNAEASLAVLREGLRTYVNARSMPSCAAIPRQRDAPELRLYLDEVLLRPCARWSTRSSTRSWPGSRRRRHPAGAARAVLRLLMRLFGRSLVVTGDVLLAHALAVSRANSGSLAAHANDPGGVAPTLAGLTGSTATVADLVSETLEVCAETFGPDARRSPRADA